MIRSNALAGIIYPGAFQIHAPFSRGDAFFSASSETFRYKNVELASWGPPCQTTAGISVLLLGNLDNLSALRAELKKRGHHSQGESPEEWIAFAYTSWGERFIDHLRGDFSLILFDEECENLYLFRDLYGKTTLYWSEMGEYFLFATHLKLLLAGGIVPATPDYMSLSSFLHFGFIPQDLSPIKGVNKLLPGHCLKINLKRQLTMTRYGEEKRDASALSSEMEPSDAIGNLVKALWLLEEPIATTHLRRQRELESAPLHNNFLLPLCRLFHLNARWKMLRSQNREPSYATPLFSESERKKLSPLLYKYFNPKVFALRFTTVEPSAASLFVQERLIGVSAEIGEPLVEKWRHLPEFHTLFEHLESGLLVSEGLLSKRWIHTQLSYPFLIPRTFEQLWALIILEIWFRLFINKPIGPIPEMSTWEYLK